ncbi:hypothetical protein AGMMS49938_13340 [Fibrobacterales bacterium]|nr:hypothetical protein AGMMS49938_13340 [Fibrobacterales bacterium]
MKKVFAIIAVTVCAIAILNQSAFAQEANSEIKFGARVFGGATDLANKRDLELASNTEIGFGMGVGAVSLIPFYGIYFAPELSFESHSFKSNEQIGYSTYEVKYEEWGLKANLNFRFHYREENLVYFEVGPAFNFALDPKANISGLSLDLDDERSAIDFGLNLGIGFRLSEHHSLDYKIFRNFTGFSDSNNDLVLIAMQIGYSYMF